MRPLQIDEEFAHAQVVGMAPAYSTSSQSHPEGERIAESYRQSG